MGSHALVPSLLSTWQCLRYTRRICNEEEGRRNERTYISYPPGSAYDTRSICNEEVGRRNTFIGYRFTCTIIPAQYVVVECGVQIVSPAWSATFIGCL